jgi:hypothetical protein
LRPWQHGVRRHHGHDETSAADYEVEGPVEQPVAMTPEHAHRAG